MANLIFKFNWEHRPYPYNAAQGKQQFMLPFASGIPNLTPDWTQVQGLGNAATFTAQTSKTDITPNSLLRVGAYGWGEQQSSIGAASLNLTEGDAVDYPAYNTLVQVSNATTQTLPGYSGGISLTRGNSIHSQLLMSPSLHEIYYRVRHPNINSGAYSLYRIWTQKNTTVDANGFVKSASPIVKLFANSVELNDDAKDQEITFEKLDIGDYLIKGSLGFAKEGWYIEIPKDANGNTVVAVLYETLENGDISIKTYKRKFDFEIAAVVADLDNPLDIPAGRWIDVRLHEEPISENLLNDLDEPVSDTPVEFQPTNLAKAVADAMTGMEPPEINEESI